MPRRGMLIMTDGTPHDWFGNGKKFSLHMTLDDATGYRQDKNMKKI